MSTLDRPTFHESWYRVADMRPRLRPAVQTRRQAYRNRLWHVVRDPANNQFFRLDDAAYGFVGLLNGKRTVAEAWDIANENLGDRAPTQGEVIQLLGQLYSSNLLLGDVPADAAGMFERQRKRVRKEVTSYMQNVLFARFPLWDPDAVLERWHRVVDWVFGPVGIMLWAALLFVAGWHLTGRWSELFAAAQPQSMLKQENLILLYVVFALIKGIHELGHGFACKRFGKRDGSGGEVHTIGIMLLVFMPVPYVDASTSWSFRSKWQRAFVAAAGMYVELAVAAVAAIVWSYTARDTLIHDLAYNAMFVAGVSTLLFNANPLLRYDGYYILSDVTEMPNLSQRSKDYLYYLVKRYAYGVRKPRNPANTMTEKPWLVIYGVAAAVYRIVIFAAILLYVAGMMFLLGVLMAIAGLITMMVVPIVKFIRYLLTSPELERVRSRALGVTGVVVLLFAALIGMPRVPDRCRAEGIVEPEQIVSVHAMESGLITDVLPSSTPVESGKSVLVSTDNKELEAIVKMAEAEHDLAVAEWRIGRANEPALDQPGRQRIAVTRRIADRARERYERLHLTAPAAGVWLSPDIERFRGAYVEAGQKVGIIADTSNQRIRLVTDQRYGPLISGAFESGDLTVELRVRGRPDLTYAATVERVMPAGRRDLPSRALSLPAGGSTPIDPASTDRPMAAEPVFEVHVRAEPGDAPLLSGQRVIARFELSRKPLAVQWYRQLRQLVQQRFAI